MIICLLHVSSVFQEHFLEVIQNQEFLLLPTAEIVKLLSSDDINVPDEETIFQALMMWVRYDVQHRQQDLGVLLAFIRLPLLPPQVRHRGKGPEVLQGSCTVLLPEFVAENKAITMTFFVLSINRKCHFFNLCCSKAVHVANYYYFFLIFTQEFICFVCYMSGNG